MAVSEHTDSRQPVRPQLHSGSRPWIADDALVRDEHVAEFAAEAFAPLDDIAVDDDAAAQSRADDGGERGFAAVAAEEREVSPKRAGVAVVQIGDGLVEAHLPDSGGYRSPPNRDARSWWSPWR